MSKSTYAGYLTVPGATTDPIVGSPNTSTGGDIVANFKAIGDIIQKSSKNSTGGTVGCDSWTYASGTRTILLGSSFASTSIPNSVNTMYNSNTSYITGVTGWRGLSNGWTGGSYTSESIFPVDSTGYAILEVDAIFVDSSSVRSNARYRLVVDYSSYPSVLSVTLLQGTDTYAQTRFSVSNGTVYLDNPDGKMHFLLNIHYTLLQSASSSYSSYNSYSSYYGS